MKTQRESQRLAVWRAMEDGRWHHLSEIARKLGDLPEQSVSARLRDFRKSKFGGHTVERKPDGPGLFKYRLIRRKKEGAR